MTDDVIRAANKDAVYWLKKSIDDGKIIEIHDLHLTIKEDRIVLAPRPQLARPPAERLGHDDRRRYE